MEKLKNQMPNLANVNMQTPQTFDIFKISNLPKLWQKPDANSILDKC